MQPSHGTAPAASSAPVASKPTQPDKLIRLPAVCELTGLGKSTIYGTPGFPKRVVLSRRAVGWRLSEVTHWIESRIAASAQS